MSAERAFKIKALLLGIRRYACNSAALDYVREPSAYKLKAIELSQRVAYFVLSQQEFLDNKMLVIKCDRTFSVMLLQRGPSENKVSISK